LCRLVVFVVALRVFFGLSLALLWIFVRHAKYLVRRFQEYSTKNTKEEILMVHY
jgi:hypothetical protein